MLRLITWIITIIINNSKYIHLYIYIYINSACTHYFIGYLLRVLYLFHYIIEMKSIIITNEIRVTVPLYHSFRVPE